MCSDGLSNMVENREICQIVSGEGSLGDKARNLIARANQKGGRDNIAVVLVEPLGNGGDAPC